MKISTRGRYALKIMMDLATSDSGEYVPLKTISDRQQVSMKYLEQIVALLNKAGYLDSARGAHGGYKLNKPAEEYVVGDILRAVEGPMVPVSCLAGGAEKCGNCANCTTKGFWKGLYEAMQNYVDGVTLQELAEEQATMGNNTYVI
jgi:Rrf2 family protein